MKTSLLIIAVFLSINVFGLHPLEEDAIVADTTLHDTLPVYGNLLKVNLGSALLYSLSFQYERVMSPKTSIAIGLNYRPGTGIPFGGTIKRLSQGQTDEIEINTLIDGSSLNFLAITPEFRYYPGSRGVTRGFYMAPFMRYAKWDAETIFIFDPEDNPSDMMLTGGLSYIAAGVMIGFQWDLSERLSFDWWLLGPMAGSVDASFFARGHNFIMNEEEKDDFVREIKNLKLVVLDLDAEKRADGVDVYAKGLMAGLRAMGLTLAFRF